MTLLTGLYEGVFNTSLTGLKNVGKIIWGGGGGGLEAGFHVTCRCSTNIRYFVVSI